VFTQYEKKARYSSSSCLIDINRILDLISGMHIQKRQGERNIFIREKKRIAQADQG